VPSLANTHWTAALVERLHTAALPSGGWTYPDSIAAAAEPTALAILALERHPLAAESVRRALDHLAVSQRPDGAVPVAESVRSPGWPTALAMLAWTLAADDDQERWRACAARAAQWLCTVAGRSPDGSPSALGHDPTIAGWSWVDGTHSWVEPTAYAVLALRAAGLADHPRARDGVRLLLDRALPDGGWNYGNTRVFDNTLRPFADSTGIALAALAAEPREQRIDAAVRYLAATLEPIRAPFSLGWGIIGLTACNARPPAADAWLTDAAERTLRRPANPVYDALLLLAHEKPAFQPRPEVDHDA
jgi:hypothetical protein